MAEDDGDGDDVADSQTMVPVIGNSSGIVQEIKLTEAERLGLLYCDSEDRRVVAEAQLQQQQIAARRQALVAGIESRCDCKIGPGVSVNLETGTITLKS